MTCPVPFGRTALLVLPALCLALMAGCTPPALGWDSAIPPGLSDIEVPPVGDPVCANCGGSGCSMCQPEPPDEDPDPPSGQTTNPAPPPSNTGTTSGTGQTQPVKPPPSTGGSGTGATAPPPVTNPPPKPDPFVQARSTLAQSFRTPIALSAIPDPSADSPLPVSPIEEEGLLASGPMPRTLRESGTLTAEEWAQARACQREIDAIYSRWPLSAADIARLDVLEPQRNALWARAVSTPGLTAEERERMRLSLHTVPASSQLPVLTSQQAHKWGTPPPVPAGEPPKSNPIVKSLLNEFTVEKPAALIETLGEQFAEQNLGKYGGKFGNLLAIAKIGVAYKQSGGASALASTADWLVGCIQVPQAQLAMGGGRAYADVAYRAQTKFMEDAMSVTGGKFDATAFWEDLKKTNGVGFAALMEWTGYGK